jgi:hypothetical protein
LRATKVTDCLYELVTVIEFATEHWLNCVSEYFHRQRRPVETEAFTCLKRKPWSATNLLLDRLPLDRKRLRCPFMRQKAAVIALIILCR